MNTRITAIEKENHIANRIKVKLKSLGFQNFIVINDNVSDIQLDHDGNYRSKFDFIYLDLCGQLTPSLLDWLSAQSQKCAFSNAKMILTLSPLFRRGSEFKDKIAKYLRDEQISIDDDIKPNLVGDIYDYDSYLYQHRLIGTLLEFVGNLNYSAIYKGIHTAMYVYSFDAHSPNCSEALRIVKFLARYTNQRPTLINPSVKAWAKRRDICNAPPKNRDVELLKERVFQLERQLASLMDKQLKVMYPKAQRKARS